MSSFDPDSFEGQVITRLARIEENFSHVCKEVEKHRAKIEKMEADLGDIKTKTAIFGTLLGGVGGVMAAWLKTKLGI